MISRSSKQGAVLVAGMLVLAILSLLGAASLLTASLDARLISNQRGSKQAFYAAEAALNIGIGDILQAYTERTLPINTGVNVAIAQPGHPINGADFNGFTISYQVDLLGDAVGAVPVATPMATFENAQSIDNTVYSYEITGIADHPTLNDHEEVHEVIRVIERPLNRYLAFFEDDMSWSQGGALTLNQGARIHANGDIHFGPTGPMIFMLSNASIVGITAGGSIFPDSRLQQGGGGGSSASGADITLDTNQIAGYAPVTLDSAIEILPTNHAAIEQGLFPDGPATGVLDSLLRVGVNRIEPAIVYDDLKPGTPGGYEEFCDGTTAAVDYDTIYIYGNGLGISVHAKVEGDATGSLVTTLVENIETSGGTNALVNGWGDGRINFDGSSAFTGAPPSGTIVYEGTLGDTDPREGVDYAVTVIDVQRLEYWYKDWMLAVHGIDIEDPSLGRRLMIYATRVGTDQAIKLIGSSGGRVSTITGQRQTGRTTWVPTTIVSDLPIYIQGDFNRGVAGGIDVRSGSPTTIISDAVTVLSNDWNVAPAAGAAASNTSVNAAFFTGRADYLNTGGGNAEGVESLLRLIEDWSGQTLTTIGSFSSLWFSEKATGVYAGPPFTAPTYAIQWDPAFTSINEISDPTAVPPIVPTAPPETPKAYMVMRQAWQER